MEVQVALTKQSLAELRRYSLVWLVDFYEIVHHLPFAIVFAFPVAGVAHLVEQASSDAPDWSSAIGLLIISLIPACFVVWRLRRWQRKRKLNLTSAFPQRLVLSPEGIETHERSGRILFVPWKHYSGFKQSKTLFLLRISGKLTYRPIPFDLLAAETQGAMRSFFLANLREF